MQNVERCCLVRASQSELVSTQRRNRTQVADFGKETFPGSYDEAKKNAVTRKAQVPKKIKAKTKIKKPLPTKKSKPAKAAKTAIKHKQPTSKALLKTAKTKDETEPKSADLYVRHLRECERWITKLERTDKFGWFLETTPDEWVEEYTTTNATASSPKKMVNAKHASSGKQVKAKQTKEAPLCFPLHPPYDLIMVRKRFEHGRYVVDRERAEEDERFRAFAPYYSTLPSPPRRTVEFLPDTPNARVLYKKGFHWELFRDDIVGMCKAAVERDDADDASDRSSLTFAAIKIKEVRRH
jgi:hypothetical protein